MDILKGYVDHIIFHNEENGYTVAVIAGAEGEITCVGTMPGITEGLTVEFQGSYVEHPTYGTQFRSESFLEVLPEDEEAIRRYLASGAIKGIGRVMAERIVERFGTDTFRIMDDAPEELAQIKGISKKKAIEIAEYMAENRAQRAAMTYLGQFLISMNLAVKIYHYYGDRIYTILKENPYQLAYDIKGVGFRIADEIAMNAGLRADSENRIQCGITYVLDQAEGEGHTYLPEELLIARASQTLRVERELIEDQLMELSIDRRIIVRNSDGERDIFSARMYKMEGSCAYLLNDLNIEKEVSKQHVETMIDTVTASSGIELADNQRQAVRQALKRGVLVITGGPGTGKTTTINTLIGILELEGRKYCLAAPTGRAAKRMGEACHRKASTIHRLLEFSGDPDEEIVVGRDAGDPLEYDYVIIDEVSMVDIYLFQLLLKAICAGTTLVLVGDVNQLPSVGPGAVLEHIIASRRFEVVELKEIFRQAKESDIIVNAHKINRGEHIALDNHSRDFFFLERTDTDVVCHVMLDLMTRKLPAYLEVEPGEIQVLTPTRKGLLGVENLNKVLQQSLNPPSPEKDEYQRGDGVVFREGDKVMQIKNNYQLAWETHGRYGVVTDSGLGVFNGDMGRIRVIDGFMENITVVYDDGHIVVYPFKSAEELELSYAVTVHKSQGSEYPAVIIPILSGPQMLLNRNILYTAVTRARRGVFIVGSAETVMKMIDNDRQDRRYSALSERLKENDS